MNRWIGASAAAALLFVVAAAPAQQRDAREPTGGRAGENLDVTMTLLPEGATSPEAVTRVIQLPRPANTPAKPGAGRGSGAHREAVPDAAGRAPEQAAQGGVGPSTGGRARELGGDLGRAASGEAQENREDSERGASSALGSPADHGRPDLPTPPGASNGGLPDRPAPPESGRGGPDLPPQPDPPAGRGH